MHYDNEVCWQQTHASILITCGFFVGHPLRMSNMRMRICANN